MCNEMDYIYNYEKVQKMFCFKSKKVEVIYYPALPG
jgi:hypothetical protein